MTYVLTGFSHDLGFRVFGFECIGEGWVRTAFSVRADLALARKHGIPVQELPLLCRGVLERRDQGEDRRAFTYTEAQMGQDADTRAANREAAAKRRKGKPPESRQNAPDQPAIEDRFRVSPGRFRR